MTESLLTTLDIKPEDKLIAIRENKLADSTFILSSIMSQCFSEQNNVCLVILHHTIGHYFNIGRRLGYDLLTQIKCGHAKTIEPQKAIVDNIGNEIKTILSEDKEERVKQLFELIKTVIDKLLENNRQTTLIIDDISHLLDLNIDLKYVVKLFKACFGLTVTRNVNFVVNCHVGSNLDEILSNFLFHSADLTVNVSALKTGPSRNVSGVFAISRRNETIESLTRQSVFHYKLFDKEIRTFAPGRAIV